VRGGLTLSDGSVVFEGSPRGFERIGARVALEQDRVVLENLEMHESDMQVDDRWVRLSGALTLAELKPQSATARLEAERWLAMGPFEVPHAELTGTIAVDADLSSPHRTVDVELVDLLLSQPNR